MSCMMIENLFEKPCSLISEGAKKLVGYVHKVAKSIIEYVSRKVTEDLSRLRNLWTLLKACISSAMNYIMEKSLEGIWFIMKWIMQLFKWFTDQLVELIRTFENVSKSAFESVRKSVKALMEKVTILGQDRLLPCLQKMSQNRDLMDVFCSLDGPRMADLVQDLMDVFCSLFDLINVFTEKILSTPIDDDGNGNGDGQVMAG